MAMDFSRNPYFTKGYYPEPFDPNTLFAPPPVVAPPAWAGPRPQHDAVGLGGPDPHSGGPQGARPRSAGTTGFLDPPRREFNTRPSGWQNPQNPQQSMAGFRQLLSPDGVTPPPRPQASGRPRAFADRGLTGA